MNQRKDGLMNDNVAACKNDHWFSPVWSLCRNTCTWTVWSQCECLDETLNWRKLWRTFGRVSICEALSLDETWHGSSKILSTYLKNNQKIVMVKNQVQQGYNRYARNTRNNENSLQNLSTNLKSLSHLLHFHLPEASSLTAVWWKVAMNTFWWLAIWVFKLSLL